MVDPDFAQLPNTPDGWRTLASQLSQAGDTLERHFLELKGDVPLDRKENWAKVAKFVLGASNRNPSFARIRFSGHAVMLLGVRSGAVEGIPAFEPQDLVDYVSKITGHPGPPWQYETIGLDNGRFLTAIVVGPPAAGRRPHLCHSDGPESLRRSEIYLRVDGATRVANPDEKMEMIEEAKASRPSTQLRVAILGTAYAYRADETVLDEYLARVKARLISAIPPPQP